MEIFEAKMMTDGTLSGKDDLTILKPEDTVVTMQLVEKTEISVVKVVRGDKEGEGNEVMENVKEGYFGNLVGGDGYDGMAVNVNMVQDGKEGEGNEVTLNVKEGYLGNLVDVDGHDGMGINVNMVQDDKEGEGNEVMDDEKEGYFGNLFDCDGDDGMGVNVNMVQDDKEGEGNEVIEDDKEGYFGNLADGDGDDGMGVNANRVQDGKEGEGKEVMENLKEGYFGNLVDVDGQDGMDVDCGENGTSQAMDVGGSLADQNNENGTKIFDDENIEKLEEFDVGENEKEDHNFVVGDFVWGKFKTHPWWPGRIYSPSDASDIAARLNPKGRLLVAYFGDGSFSWSSPSQLKPFIDHFPEMSSQTDSKKFVNAVKISLEEVSRLVEAGLMCKCQTVSRTGSVGNFGNRGIKKGVPVPKGNMVKVLVDRMEPVEVLLSLKDAAMTDPGARLTELELVLLKSCLNVFYGKKGGYLREYHDPMCIEGLEDDTRNGVVTDCPSGSIDDGDDKLYQGRKQKSVMELLGEDELKSKKTKTVKDGGSGNKRKRKVLVVSVTPESDHESGGGGGVEDSISPRQRKKSKYLSPPYLSPVGSGKLSGSGLFKERKPEPEKVLETAAKHHEDSLKTIDIAVDVKKVLHGLLCVALDPTSFAEKTLHTVADFILYYRSSIFEEASSYPTERKKTTGYASNLAVTKQKLGSGRKKNGADTSELAVIKQKLEWMLETVKGCEESKMSADVKASLEGGIQEVLQKVGKMKGK